MNKVFLVLMLLLIMGRVFALCLNKKKEIWFFFLHLFNAVIERIKQKIATVFINGPAVNVISWFLFKRLCEETFVSLA